MVEEIRKGILTLEEQVDLLVRYVVKQEEAREALKACDYGKYDWAYTQHLLYLEDAAEIGRKLKYR